MRQPSTIVLDTFEFIGKFREFVVHTGRSYWFVEDMVQEVMHCLRNKRLAMERLDLFYMEILYNDAEYDEGIIEDIYAPYIHDLGTLLFRRMIEAGVYNQHGTHDYRITVISNTHFNDVILRKREGLYTEIKY